MDLLVRSGCLYTHLLMLMSIELVSNSSHPLGFSSHRWDFDTRLGCDQYTFRESRPRKEDGTLVGPSTSTICPDQVEYIAGGVLYCGGGMTGRSLAGGPIMGAHMRLPRVVHEGI